MEAALYLFPGSMQQAPSSFLDLFLDNKAGLSLGGARLDVKVLGGFGQLITVGTALGNSREDEISCGQE